jgi:hypothetical protein
MVAKNGEEIPKIFLGANAPNQKGNEITRLREYLKSLRQGRVSQAVIEADKTTAGRFFLTPPKGGSELQGISCL